MIPWLLNLDMGGGRQGPALPSLPSRVIEVLIPAEGRSMEIDRDRGIRIMGQQRHIIITDDEL